MVRGEYVVLPRLQIGKCIVHGLIGAAQTRNTARCPETEVPIIGNSVLSYATVTFDFARKELVLRDSGYNPRRHIADGGCAIRLSIQAGGRHQPAYLFMTCSINGRPVRAILDTGNNAGIVLSETIAAKLGLRARKWSGDPAATATGAIPTAIAPVSFELGEGPVRGTADARVLKCNHLINGVDASLGLAILRHFRVTTDYHRGWLVLERRRSAV